MFCAISGHTPEEPVVTPEGHLFERNLIEKYIETHGKCPVSGKELQKEDLIKIESTHVVKPRPVTATSIPGLLALFQNEWDSLMLETYKLKQHLDTVRQELSHSLYQHDAACRVIARLIKERDEARQMLNAIQGGSVAAPAPAAEEDAGMEVEAPEQGISKTVAKVISQKSSELSKGRKKRQISPNLASVDDLQEFSLIGNHPGLHSTSKPGVLCVDLHPKDAALVATGGADGNVVLFNRDDEKVVSKLSRHKKPVLSLKFHKEKDLIFTGSGDKTALVWSPATEGSLEKWNATPIATHSGDVTAVSLHATGDFLATASKDASWAFHDIASCTTLTRINDPAINGSPYRCGSFHPDGLIYGTGTEDSLIRMFDIKTLQNVATFEGHKGAVASLSFSENGYYLATAAADATVKLWDLRKLKNLKTLTYDEGTNVSSVRFDHSGLFLAVGAGKEVKTYVVKTWQPIASYVDHSAEVTDVCFGTDAGFLASTSKDRSLKFWGKK